MAAGAGLGCNKVDESENAARAEGAKRVRGETGGRDRKITLYVDLGSENRRTEAGEEHDPDQDDAHSKRSHGEEEGEDGVHGGRMKPLASFDVNRPPAHCRKLRIKLSSNSNPAPMMAAPKEIQLSQEKENGGLVPPCPGTIHIRGMKRRAIGVKELKPHKRKRTRVEMAPSTDQSLSNGGPTVTKGDEGSRMDMLLMALMATEPKPQGSESPCLPLSAAGVIDIEASKAKKPVCHDRCLPSLRPVEKDTKKNAVRLRVLMPNRNRLPVQLSLDDDGQVDEEGRRKTNVQNPGMSAERKSYGGVSVQEEIKRTREERKEDDEETDEDVDETLLLKPHGYRPAASKSLPTITAQEGKERKHVERKEDQEETEDDTDETLLLKPDGYRPAPSKSLPRISVQEEKERKHEESKESDEETDDGVDESCMRKPHRYRPAPSKSLPTIFVQEEKERKLEGRKESDEETYDGMDESGMRKPDRYRPAPSKSLPTISGQEEKERKHEERKESEEETDDGIDESCMRKPTISVQEETKRKPEERKGSDEETDQGIDETGMMKTHRYRPAPSKAALEEMKRQPAVTKEDDEEPAEKLETHAARAHRNQQAPSNAALEMLERELDLSTEEEEETEDELDRLSIKPSRFSPRVGVLPEWRAQYEGRRKEKGGTHDILTWNIRPVPTKEILEERRQYQARREENEANRKEKRDTDGQLKSNARKPHHPRPAPPKTTLVKSDEHRKPRKDEPPQTNCTDDDQDLCVIRLKPDAIGSAKSAAEEMKRQPAATTEDDEEIADKLDKHAARAHRNQQAPSKAAPEMLNREHDSSTEEEEETEVELDRMSIKPSRFVPREVFLPEWRAQYEALRKENGGTDDKLTWNIPPVPTKEILEERRQYQARREENEANRKEKGDTDGQLESNARKPHHPRPAPPKTTLVKSDGHLEPRKDEPPQRNCTDYDDQDSCVMRLNPDALGSAKSAAEEMKRQPAATTEDDEETADKLDKHAARAPRNQQAPSKAAPEMLDREHDSSTEEEETEDELDRMSIKPSRFIPREVFLPEWRAQYEALRKEKGGADDKLTWNIPPVPTKEILDERRQYQARREENEANRKEKRDTDGQLKSNARKPHHPRPAPPKTTLVKSDGQYSIGGKLVSAQEFRRLKALPVQVKSDGPLDCIKEEQEETSSSDDDRELYAMKPHRYSVGGKLVSAQAKSDGTRDSTKEKQQVMSCGDDDRELHAMKPNKYSTGAAKLAVKDHINQQAKRTCSVSTAKGDQIVGPSGCKVKESLQLRVPDIKPSGQGSRVGTLQEEAGLEATEVPRLVANPEDTKKASAILRPGKDSVRTNYPGTSHQRTTKESVNVSERLPCISKKRKASNYMPASADLPKQVILTPTEDSQSRLNVSFGRVIVDVLPASTGPKRQDPASTRNIEEIGEARRTGNSPEGSASKPGKGNFVGLDDDTGNVGIDKDNAQPQSRQVGTMNTNEACMPERSAVLGLERTEAVAFALTEEQRKVGTHGVIAGRYTSTNDRSNGIQSSQGSVQKREDAASNGSTYAGGTGGMKAPPISYDGSAFGGVTVAHYDGSANAIPELVSVVRVADDCRSLQSSSLTNSLPQEECSRRCLDTKGSRIRHTSKLQSNGLVQDQSSGVVRSDSMSCSRYTLNQEGASRIFEDKAHHEIAGITMRRRSWEALKAAELLAKQRFIPKIHQTFGTNLPSIPSRFQDANHLKQLDSNRPTFGSSHLSHNTALQYDAVIAVQRSGQRRGPRQGQREKLSTKVLTKSVEDFVRLKDGNPSAGNFHQRILTQIQNREPIPPANGRHYNASLPLQSWCGVPKVALPRVRNRRGSKKAEKEKLSIRRTKNDGHFKLLSEPSGFLGDFNPGIMQRVRNKQQIRAILGALIGATASTNPKESGPRPPVAEAATQQLAQDPHSTDREEPHSRSLEKEIHDGVQDVEQEITPAGSRGGGGLAVDATATCNGGEPMPQDTELPERTLNPVEAIQTNPEERRELMAADVKVDKALCRDSSLASPNCEAVKRDCTAEQSGHDTQEKILGPQYGHDDKHSVCEGEPDWTEDGEPELPPLPEPGSSPAAAGLAARWLQILTLDIKGRLSALKQSRRRVRSTLESAQLDSRSGSAILAPSLPLTCLSKGVDGEVSQPNSSPDAMAAEDPLQQLGRWHALFLNMDSVLGMEAAKLEKWLWQIHHMQAFCPDPNQQPAAWTQKTDLEHCKGGTASSLGIENQPPLRWPVIMEPIERELAVAASAASMMSTANFVAKAQTFR